jgi:hypothetical protein
MRALTYSRRSSMRATTPQPASAAASAAIPRILISVILPRPGAIQAQPAVDDKGERAKVALRWK